MEASRIFKKNAREIVDFQLPKCENWRKSRTKCFLFLFQTLKLGACACILRAGAILWKRVKTTPLFFIAGATLCASALYNIVAGAPFCDVAKAMSKVVARTAFCGAF